MLYRMSLTADLSKRVDKKRQEIVALEQQMLAARAYVQAMEEALRLAGRMNAPETARERSSSLRQGSLPAKAYPVLKRNLRPMYLVALLEGMEVQPTNKNKRALASSLSAYARKREIFTRPEPNTFGLIEFEEDTSDGSSEGEPVEETSSVSSPG